MNIIELVKQIVTDFPQLSALSDTVSIDFADHTQIDNFGIYPTGDQLLSEDVCGNQKRQHNFIFYAVFQGINDYERLTNSTFLLDLAYWLEHAANNQQIETTINGQIVAGRLTKLNSANGMLYDRDGTLSGPVTYQLQISAQYKLESEVL